MKYTPLKPETFFQCFLLQKWPINAWLLSRKIVSDLLLFSYSTNILQQAIWDSPLSRLTHQDFQAPKIKLLDTELKLSQQQKLITMAVPEW